MPNFPILDAQTPESLDELIEGIDFRVTFDVGHLNTTTRDFDSFIETFRERTVHIHLHDNFGKRNEHLALGEGNIPWERVLQRLSPKTWALEVEGLKEAELSLKFIKEKAGIISPHYSILVINLFSSSEFNSSLCSSKSCYWNSIWRTTYIIEANKMTKFY
ncbi:MAG: hypothetical protein PWP28_2130 [Oceanotoga sp.]|nr:hypothetical protein [Oceanotoga sp.]